MRRTVLALSLLALLACRKGSEAPEPAKAEATPSLPTPVRVAKVEKATLPLYVSGPGKTAALSQEKVRAPFAGTLVELSVSDGDSVRKGQTLGAIVSRESEAAISGAREMKRQASTEVEKRDAERAEALAQGNLIRRALVASADGSVLSHAASAGDRVSEDQEILTISDAGSVVFLADIPQSDLPRVKPGQQATIDLAGGRPPVSGPVHAVLPGANSADFTGQVRVDLRGSAGSLTAGLFGTARILVDERAGVPVVPSAAVLRDDVSGVSRLCLAADGKAHWIDVVTGARDAARTEIVSPALTEGQLVIVSGLVGLPEGKSVSIESK